MTPARVTSRDGAAIGYLQTGRGPGLVLIQGALGGAAHYHQLAEALAPRFSVLLPDRRGRGISPRPYAAGHDIGRDVEDVEAVCAASGARFVFGLSSGAMIALDAARRLSCIDKAAVYEPPFYPSDIDRKAVARFHAEVERRDLASALATAGRIVGLAPPPLRVLPAALVRRITQAVLHRDARNAGDGYLRLSEAIPAMRYDFDVVASRQGAMAAFGALHKPVMVLNGTRSPAYLKRAVARLAATLPDARRAALPGLNHSGPWNADKGGRPDRVAAALGAFFT